VALQKQSARFFEEPANFAPHSSEKVGVRVSSTTKGTKVLAFFSGICRLVVIQVSANIRKILTHVLQRKATSSYVVTCQGVWVKPEPSLESRQRGNFAFVRGA